MEIKIGDLVKFREPYDKWYDSNKIGVIVQIYEEPSDQVKIFWADQSVQDTNTNILKIIECKESIN